MDDELASTSEATTGDLQHYVAQTHLKRFLSGKKGEGKLYIYDKTSPDYREGLPRRIRSGKFEMKPPRYLCTYRTNHSEPAEHRMGRVESEMIAEWDRLKAETKPFGPEAIPGIIRYMVLTDARRPPILGQVKQAVRQAVADQIPEEALCGLERQEPFREMVSFQRYLQPHHSNISMIPYWRFLNLPSTDDEEFLISDRPVVIALAGPDVSYRSLAIMPMCKKQLLVGTWSKNTFRRLELSASLVNTMAFARAEKEIYSHRRLDSGFVKMMIAVSNRINAAVAGERARRAG